MFKTLLLYVLPIRAFIPTLPRTSLLKSNHLISSCNHFPTKLHMSGYIPPEQSTENFSTRLPPYPKVGDVVRYMDLDGGRIDGQILIGKITFIQSRSLTSSEQNNDKEWLCEIVELDDVGDGYYAEFPSRERKSRKSLRNLLELAPVPASFVRAEDAYKIPFILTEDGRRTPNVSFENYRVDGYKGPAAVPINQEVLESDGERYNELKGVLLKDAALFGLVGTLLAQLIKGTEDALIYFAGALAGVGYLFFLSLKTDTVGSQNSDLGKNVSNFRFFLPVLVLLGVSFKNMSTGTTIPNNENLSNFNYFDTVTPEQFASAMIGFLSYRIPLFVRQLQPIASDSAMQMIPGSAGVAMQQIANAKNKLDAASLSGLQSTDDLVPVLLVSGPPGTGKTTLIQELISKGNGRFVRPAMVDKISTGAQFEVMQQRGEILEVSGENGRYGLTVDSIINAVPNETTDEEDGGDNEDEKSKAQVEKVVVVDASVDLTKKLTNVGGLRLIGVWIGLDATEKFESRFQAKIADGSLTIPEDETEESVIRGKIREAVNDIEYGVVSGVFEFTILNDNFDESMKQLEAAAEYCFK